MRMQRGLMYVLMGLALGVAGCASSTTTAKDDASGLSATTPVATATDGNQQKQSAEPAKAGSSSNDSAKSTALQKSILFENIYFDFDAATLSAAARTSLAQAAKQLMGSSAPQSVKIEGHCDERGSSEYNMALGEKRARAAQSYLMTLGVPAERLSVISYGKERPADAGHDEKAWAKNRRDEIKPN